MTIIRDGKEVPVKYRCVATTDAPCPCGKPKKTVKENETTCVGYAPEFDAAGDLHDHDDNCCSVEATCEAGHRYAAPGYFRCPCGWRSKESCWCVLSRFTPRLIPEGIDSWC